VEFLRKGLGMRQPVAIFRGLAGRLALSAGLQAQPFVLRARRQAEGLLSRAVHVLAEGRSWFVRGAVDNGAVRFFGLCCVALLVLLLAFALMRMRQLREKNRELECMVDERARELELTREQVRIQLAHDVLTGMLNRAGILRELSAEMDRTRREGGSLLVALVDLDSFKRVNDAYGYQAGDEALRWFAAAIGAAIRVYDHAGRYGGEEFLLVLTEIPHGGAGERLASLHASISKLEIRTREAEFEITCSMGAAVFGPSADGESAESVLATADLALYQAKVGGRNRAYLHRADSSGAGDEKPQAGLSRIR
jgi:diguanylate cyclase (GGDEF)-like protein